MKKKVALLALLMIAVVSMTACGELNPNKYVKVGEYKGIEISVPKKQEVTDATVASYIQNVVDAQTTYEPITDRAVQEGDQVNIDYVGKKDGKAFEGGTSPEGGYDLVIGSGKFIPGFEEGLIGSKSGESLDIDLTFPKEYGQADLAGQPVVFSVSVNAIKEPKVPELTDELVPTLEKECKNVAEYQAYVKKMLEEQAQAAYDESVRNAAFDKLYAGLTVSNPPQEMIDTYFAKSMENADTYASYYGLSREDFLTQQLQTTTEAFEKQAKTISTEAAKQELVIRAIAKKEKIEIADADVTKFAEENLSYYGFDTAEAMVEQVGKEWIEYTLMNQKVLTILGDNAVITEEAATEQATTEQAVTEEATSTPK
ncbi:MAG: trigger factor [Lachnospiraceae bacterium]